MKNITASLLLLLFFNYSKANQYWLSQPTQALPGAANGPSGGLQVSSNGRYLTFLSQASNWTDGDVNALTDLFVQDLQTGETTLVSRTGTDSQLFSGSFFRVTQVSDDGQTVLFLTDSLDLPNSDGDLRVYSKNLDTGLVINQSEYGGGDYFETMDINLSTDGLSMFFSTPDLIDPLHVTADSQVYRKDLSNDSYSLVSVSTDGLAEAENGAVFISSSSNGRYVLMRTTADNLLGVALPNDHLLLKDLNDDTYQLITQQPNGDPSATTSTGFSSFDFGFVSDIGTVLFSSSASDLIANDTNMENDLFIYDQGQVRRISLNQSGGQVSNPLIINYQFSGDGNKVMFVSQGGEFIPALNIDPNEIDVTPVYQVDLNNDELSVLTAIDNVVSPGFVGSLALSLDGNLWISSAQIALPGISQLRGDESSGVIYQYDENLAQFARPNNVAFNPNTIISDMYHSILSSDQRWMLTASKSPNLSSTQSLDGRASLLLLDRYTNQWQELGRDIRFNSLSNAQYDLSASGRFVVFNSRYLQPEGIIDLGNIQMFLLDRDTGTYTLITNGIDPRVNDDGMVVFSSFDALVSEDQNNRSDVYLYEPGTATLTLISKNPNTLNAGNDSSENPDIGGVGPGTKITFDSRATDLLTTVDNNGRKDVFIADVNTGDINRASETLGVGGDGDSTDPKISNQGNALVYITRSENLTSDDYTSAAFSQFIHHDIGTETNTLASFNSSNIPIQESVTFRDYPVISDTGNFVAYTYDDNGSGFDFVNDDDDAVDVVLADMVNMQSEIVSDPFFTGSNIENATLPHISEDDSQSPPLVGVSYNSGRFLSMVAESPGHQELYLHQQGGGDTTISIDVQGSGSVTGSLGVNCQDQCEYDFSNGSSVSLVAIPNSGQIFYGWQDALNSCEAENPACQIDVDDRPLTLQAVFLDDNDIIFRDGFE